MKSLKKNESIKEFVVKTEEKINVMIDKFENMATKIEKIKLAENLRYAKSLQFLERLENCGKINVVECMRLRDVVEDVNGNPCWSTKLGM